MAMASPATEVDVVAKAKEACSILLRRCKDMVGAVEARCTEEELVEHCKRSASDCVGVGNIITTYISSIPQEDNEKTELQQTFLMDFSGKLREAVVNLVRYTRRVHANPLDFLSKSSLQNSLKDVVTGVKNVLEATVALQNAQSEKDEEKKDGKESSTAAPAANAAAEQVLATELTTQSQTVLSALELLTESIPKQDADTFNSVTKRVVAGLNELTTSLQKLGKSEAALKQLLEANLSVITAAKISFKKPANEQCTKKFDEAKNEVITAMRELLFEVSKGSSRMGRSLSRSLSQKRVSSILRSNINRQSSGSNPGIIVQAPDAAGAATPGDKVAPASSKQNVTAQAPADPKAAATPPKDSKGSAEKVPALAADKAALSPTSGDGKTSPRALSPTPDARAPRQLGRQVASMAINKPRTASSEHLDVSEGKASPEKPEKPAEKSAEKATEKPAEEKSSKPVEEKASPRERMRKRTSETGDDLTGSSDRLKKKKSSSKTKDKSESPTSGKKKLERSITTASPADLKSYPSDKPDITDAEDPRKLRRAPSNEGSDKTESDSKRKMKRVQSRELLKEIAKRKEDTEPGLKASGGGSGSGAEDSIEGSEDATANEVEGSDEDDSSRTTDSLRDAKLAPAGNPKVIQRKGSGSPVSPPLPLSGSASGSAGSQSDKQRVAQKIVSFFSEKMPSFAKEWESIDAAVKMTIENKIVAELALYQIAALQDHNPLGGPPTGGLSKLPGPTPSAAALVASGAASLRKLEVGGSVTAPKSPGGKSKKDDKKGTALPGFLKLFTSSDKSSDTPSNAPAAKDDKAVQQELERIMDMTDAAELSGMTIRLKGLANKLKISGNKAPKNSTKPEKEEKDEKEIKIKISPLPPEQAPELARLFGMAIVTFIKRIQDAAKKPKDFDSMQSHFYTARDTLWSRLREVMTWLKELATNGISSQATADVIAKTEDEANHPKAGGVSEVDPQLTTEGSYIKFLRKNLELSIVREYSNIYFTASQIMTDIHALIKCGTEIDIGVECLMLHLCALVGSMLGTLESALNDIETLHYYSEETDDSSESDTPKFESATPSVWEEFPYEPVSADNAFKSGSLNTLIMRAVADNSSDNLYSSVFFDTFTTFSTAEEILHKLIEAFNVPKGKMSVNDSVTHQQKVLQATLRFVRISRKYEFDALLNGRLKRFLEEAKGREKDLDIAVQNILDELKRQDSESDETEITLLPMEINVWDSDESPAAFALAWDPQIVARQLTKIEFDMYKNIETMELRGQAWNKLKRQCVSRNVVSMIQRANRTSYWVATTILLQPKVKDRVRAIHKIIEVAKHLKELNNFNTLMGIVAGMNMSSVSRLKSTFSQVKKASMDAFRTLQSLVDPKSSFKSLREAIRNGGQNILPYIGTTLSDLTFMEDGNTDFVTVGDRALINMEKRKLISLAIAQARFHQNSQYKLPLRDPPHTFLMELPALAESTLYALSLEREPRETTKSSK